MKRRAFSLLETILALTLLALAAALMFPRGNRTQDRLSTQTVAEELVSSLRRVRQTAVAKRVRVALAIPRSPGAAFSDTLYQLEGDTNPRSSGKVWKISQDRLRVVYFVGTWNGPNWTPAPPGFDLNQWWTGPAQRPSAHLFAFGPQGQLDSDAPIADGAYRILVAQGVSQSGGSLTQADSPWTVWARPDGTIGMDQGIFKASQGYHSQQRESNGAASLSASRLGNQSSPEKISLTAWPDRHNPKGTGNLIDATSCLTLEFHVKDQDGDPPFFHWTSQRVDGAATGDGVFANQATCRMEWSTQSNDWVGRVSWTPAWDDNGGCSYRLVGQVEDRRGGTLPLQFPVDGGLLQTTRESWVLYRSLCQNGRWELWKMTLEGEEQQRLVGFANQDIRFGQWSSSGDEVILGTASAVYRAKADGSGLRLVGTPGKQPVESCCLSPDGRYLFYVTGGNDDKQIRRVDLDAAGNESDLAMDNGRPIDHVYNLSVAIFQGRYVLLENFFRTYTKGFPPKQKKMDGIVVFDGMTDDNSDTDPPAPTLGGVGQQRGVTGGSSFNRDGTQVLWGQGGEIYFSPVNFDPSKSLTEFRLAPATSLSTGLSDVHHPRYTPDQKGLVFAEGRGNATRIYYIEDVAAHSAPKQLPLAPENINADEPSVIRRP
ncbi:MAG: hypothetical protein U0931_38570 [Vulcanimicrobiota bacterium]